MMKFGLEVLSVKASFFLLEFIDETVKKFFVYKCKLSLSLLLPHLVDLFTNKLKTKFFFFQYSTVLMKPINLLYQLCDYSI